MSNIDYVFNKTPLTFSGKIEEPPVIELKNTFSLWNASYDDAVRYGGDITRQALRAMNIRHDRKNIIVDTKIHMLLKGMSPAILGWHNDGSGRDINKHPNGKGPPDILSQSNDNRYNRYHLLVTGTGCLTQFINQPISISIPSEPSYDTYKTISSFVSNKVKEDQSIIMQIPSCQVTEFNWDDIHTGVIATKNEWRYLIRVAESDYYEPAKDLREIIRMQTQVYSPLNFGW
jgi:hypothetical protein